MVKTLDGRTLNDSGAGAWTGLGNLDMGHGAVLNLLGPATLDIQNDQSITNTLGGTATVNNAGLLLKSAGSGATSFQVGFNNSGAVQVLSGTLSLTGAFGNFSGSTLTGGSYLIGGTFQFTGANIVTNAATIVLDGLASAITDLFSNDALANLANNSGSFTIQNGRNFTTAASVTFTNTGTLAVGNSSTFTGPSTGIYTEGGTMQVGSGGMLMLPGSFSNFAGGTLTGGTFIISGTFAFANAAITTNAATIVLDGANSQITDLIGLNALNLSSNPGSLTIQNGRSLTTAGNFSNGGALTVGSNSTFTVNGTYTQSGTASVLAAGTLTLMNGGSSSGNISVDGTFAININTTFTVSGAYSQTGALIVGFDATVSLTGTFGSFSGGTLTGGSYQLFGTLQFNNAAIANAATILLDNTTSQIIDQSGNDALANLASNTGSLTVENGRALTVSGSLSNTGSVVLSSGTLTVMGNYTQTTSGASTTLNNGTLAASLVDLQAGTFVASGQSGTIMGNVRNAAQISLGDATTAGRLSISGTYTQTSAGVLTMKIGGPNPTDSDQLLISGAASLDGTLNVSLFNGFTPTSGNTFTPIMFASHATTTFATTNLDPVFVNPPTYDPTDVRLVAV